MWMNINIFYLFTSLALIILIRLDLVESIRLLRVVTVRTILLSLGSCT